jgi:hypothetical protein
MSLDNLQKKIEKDFLLQLIRLLKNNEIKLERARQATKRLLAIFPNDNFSDVETQLKTLVNEYPEFKKIIITLQVYEEEEKTKEVLVRMRKFLQEGKVDEALKVVKK